MDNNHKLSNSAGESQSLVFTSINQQSLLSIKRTNQMLRIDMYGLPNHLQTINLYQLQIPDIRYIPQLEAYFDTSHHFIEYIRNSSNLRVNYQQGILEVLTKHPTKEQKIVVIAEIKLILKQLLDHKNFIQISARCLSSTEITNQQIKCMLLGLSQQLMTLSQKAFVKTDKKTDQNKGVDEKVVDEVGDEWKMSMAKSLLEVQVDSVKQIMSKKLGKIMDEVEKNRQILINQLEGIRNKLSFMQKNMQSNTTKLRQQFQSLALINKMDLQKKVKNHINVGNIPKMMPPIFNPMIQMPMPPIFNPMPMSMPMPGSRINLGNRMNQGLTKIGQIQPGQDYQKIKGKVLKIEQKNRNMVEVVLGDQTGIVNAYLHKSNQLKINNTVILIGCIASVYRQHIQIELKTSGKLFRAPKQQQIADVQQGINISEKSWVQQY